MSKLELENTPCPLCHECDFQTFITTIDHFYRVPGEFNIVCCSGCKHHYLNPRPTRATLHLCYPETYAQHVAPHVTKVDISSNAAILRPRPWYAKPPFRWLPGLKLLYYALMNTRSTVIPSTSDGEKSVLELGCGVGGFLDQLRAAGWNAQGVEFSPSATQIVRGKGHHVLCAMIDDLDFTADSFDMICSWMVVEHLHQPLDTFMNVFSWLKPGGYFCFSVPNFGSLQKYGFGKFWQCYDLPRHLQHFQGKSIRKALIKLGFTQVRVIHQRSIQSWYASLGARLLNHNPNSKLGRTLKQNFEAPPFLWQIAVSPIAYLLAAIRQSERITIMAQKPLTNQSS